MADTIQLRAGNKAGMPELLDRELAYVKDEEALYIGTTNGNKKMGKKLETDMSTLQGTVNGYSARIESLESATRTQEEHISDLYTEKLTASVAAAQSALAQDAGLAEVVDAFNALVAAMKDSGLMKER